MDLGDRGGGQGPGLDDGEHRLERAAQVLLDDGADHLPRLGGDLVAAALELPHELLGEEPLAGGDDLAELDVGGPEALGRLAEAPRQPGP